MGKYCCFFDPERDFSEKELTDTCPKCNRTYGYILENMPAEIRNNNINYRVIRAIGRGFYGATYLCEVQKRFKKKTVLLKVTPVLLYEFFGKSFEEECNKHAQVSENTEHLVKIEDAFEADVAFGDEKMKCHIAELEYIHGQVLSEYIEDDNHVQPKIFAQIAIDLLRLWNEFILKREFHNDLHLGNLIVEQLDDSIQRVDAIYNKIKLMAIDLNSVTDESLSDCDSKRLGDRSYISNHIALLSKKLRDKYKNIDEISDTDFRLIETLNKISRILSLPSSSIDIPEISELIDMIKEEFKSNISYSPWKKTFTLSKLNDVINAQTLPSCYVPQLLVDPENKWIDEVSVLGPQLITGMRGCGKTMLLGALDIHARLVTVAGANIISSYNNLSNDRYVGITASCRDLVELDDIENNGISKLILLYSIQIIRAARHISDIDSNMVKKDYYSNLAKNLSTIFGIEFQNVDLVSQSILERKLTDISNDMHQFCANYPLRVSSITAFELLADSITSSSELLANKQVYFLLDDASTRYMSVDKISILLTKILFMSQKCAFKVTTELQTLYSFKSPGNIEMAQDIRDYQIFDLGADVYKRTSNTNLSKKFIEAILKKRLTACSGMSSIPSSLDEVLGDCKLNSLANYIIEHPSSKDRKSAYHGASALAALCVGDIGDIICLYDSILANNEKGSYPVDAKVQTHCFQQLCSRRMYNLERKDGMLREYVKAFAEASYKCLIESKKVITHSGAKSERIRQYNGLYIRMTTGNIEKQQDNLRKLIDSGIFVYADGNGWPRARSNDTDPITQIKLAFRKLFGVSNFIGLASSDRFELSGKDLEQWLEKPNKELLLRNLGVSNDAEQTDECNAELIEDDCEPNCDDTEKRLEQIVGNPQLSLFDYIPEATNNNDYIAEEKFSTNIDLTKRVNIMTHHKEIAKKNFDMGIFGLGFEERCLESVKKIVGNNRFTNIVLVEYEECGYSKEIKKLVLPASNVITVKFDDIERITLSLNNANSILIDITGLYKPIIFNVVRQALLKNKKIDVVHTFAQDYYPLNSDIQKLIDSNKVEVDDATKFADLMRGLDTGDAGSYSNMKLLENSNYDPVRPTALLGFVSPKNQRIFSILDKKEYDAVTLFTPNGNSARDMLSQTAGNIALTNYSSVRLKSYDISKPKEVMKELSNCYSDLYVDKNHNIEISLTGSKMQAVAAAAFSTVCKVAQCWYVKPGKFDTDHFTKGTANSQWYTIKVQKY